MKKTYSPIQILIATFLAGPLATAYLLKESFAAIGKKELATQSLFACLIFTAVILVILPFLPEQTPSMVLPIAYLIPLALFLQKHYPTKQEIADSETYTFESNWKTAGVSLLATIIFAVLAFGVLTVAETDEDIAQYFVENVNHTDFELDKDFYIKLEAIKEPNGSNVYLNFSLNNDVVNMYKSASQSELKPAALSFIGNEYLMELAEDNIYVTANFLTGYGEIVNTVTLSEAN